MPDPRPALSVPPSPQPPPEVSSSSPISPATGRVSWREKLAYGVGGLPVQFGEAGVKSLAVPVYQMTLGVNPALLGLMMAIPRFVDAITDPLMGHISDRTQSRYGRRRPYIFMGALLTMLSFILIWQVPMGWSQSWQLGWFLVTATLFFLCNTVWGVPYQSLGYEITPDYHERTRVMAVQAVFIKLSGFIYQWVFPLAQLAFFASVIQGVQVVTVAVGLAIFGIAGAVPALFVRERFAHTRERMAANKHLSFRAGCRAVWDNRGMRILAALTLLQMVAGMLSGSLDYYLIVYYMFDGDLVQGSIWKGILSSAYAVVGLLSIWPATWLSRRFDKRTTLRVIYAMLTVGGLMKWVLFNPDYPWLLLLDPVLCGPVYVGLSVLVPSMTADICDEDELQHGQRREGMFGAVLSWLRKTGWSLAFLGSGLALNAVGFDAALKGNQSSGTITGIRLFMVLTPSITAAIAIFVLRYYHLDEKKSGVIRAQLEARRGTV